MDAFHCFTSSLYESLQFINNLNWQLGTYELKIKSHLQIRRSYRGRADRKHASRLFCAIALCWSGASTRSPAESLSIFQHTFKFSSSTMTGLTGTTREKQCLHCFTCRASNVCFFSLKYHISLSCFIIVYTYSWACSKLSLRVNVLCCPFFSLDFVRCLCCFTVHITSVTCIRHNFCQTETDISACSTVVSTSDRCKYSV